MIEAGRLLAVPLFGDLDAHDLSIVARYVEETLAEPGDLLIEQGAMPYELFVIEEGSVDVVRDGEPLATLGPGEVVGEIALLAHHRRMASVVARTPVRALTLQVDAVQEITAEMPEVGAALQSLMRQPEVVQRRRLRLGPCSCRVTVGDSPPRMDVRALPGPTAARRGHVPPSLRRRWARIGPTPSCYRGAPGA